LLDEWEALRNPTRPEEPETAPEDRPQPVTANTRAFRVLVRNAMFRLVELSARERYEELAELAPDVDWKDALDAYFAEHDDIGIGPDARGPGMLLIEEDAAERRWHVRQIIDDPAGD